MTSFPRVLALLLITILAACGDDDGASNPDSGAGTGGSGGSGATGGSGGDMDSGAGTGATGGGGGDEDAGEIGRLIGPEGGAVQADNAVMTIPAGAVTTQTHFAITASNTAPVALPDFLRSLAAYFTITPHGTQFEAPVTIALPTNTGPTGNVSVWFLDDENDTTWEQLGMAELQGAFGVFTTTHLTIMTLAERRSSGAICIPMCGLNECGPDQCGDICGSCDSGESCVSGFCEAGGGGTGGSGGTGGQSGQGGQGGTGGSGGGGAEICNDGIDNDSDNNADCADTGCTSSCGNLNLDWSVAVNGSASTCFGAGGDTVAIVATSESTGLMYDATVVCSVGMHTLFVPAGTYDIALTLQEPGPSALLTATSDNAIVPGGGNANPDPVVFDVQTSTCASVVISRIYTRGGGSIDGFNEDFVELRNRTSQAVNVSTWSLATNFVGANNGEWFVTPLTGSIPANGFYLVRLGRGASDMNSGIALPTADATGTTDANIESYSSNVVLRSTQTAPSSGECPTSNVVDGWGTTEGCREGSQWMGGLGSTSWLQRTGTDACTDTNNNASDFTSATIGTPRNSSSTTGAACAACN